MKSGRNASPKSGGKAKSKAKKPIRKVAKHRRAASVKDEAPAQKPMNVRDSKLSNLENYLPGCNVSCFIVYPERKRDELLNAHLRGYNLHLIG